MGEARRLRREERYGACDDEGKEGTKMADKECGYAGKIQNSGAQKVQAPLASQSKKGTSTVKKGEDLRGGGRK